MTLLKALAKEGPALDSCRRDLIERVTSDSLPHHLQEVRSVEDAEAQIAFESFEANGALKSLNHWTKDGLWTSPTGLKRLSGETA